MEWIETTAKTVDEAKELALLHLGVEIDDAEFEVLDEPKTGLFGRVRGEARVRARVRPTKPRPKVERRDRRRGRADTSGDDRGKAPAEGSDAPTDASRSGQSRSKNGKQAKQAKQANGDEQQDSATAKPATPKPASRKPATPKPATPKNPTKQTTKARGTEMTNETQNDSVVEPQQVASTATTFLEGLTTAFGLESTATATVDGTEVDVRVDGADLGLLVGPRGSTLDAVQDLTRVVAQRRLGDQETRLRVDVAGYRERRREALGRFALQMADEVVASGVARVLEPMGSADRKIVHDALSVREDVSTRSEGEDPKRRVVITPQV